MNRVSLGVVEGGRVFDLMLLRTAIATLVARKLRCPIPATALLASTGAEFQVPNYRRPLIAGYNLRQRA